MWQLNQGHRPSRFSCHCFSNVDLCSTLPSSPSFSCYFSTFLSTLSSDSLGSLSLSCQSHQTSHMQVTQLDVLQLNRCNLLFSRLPLLSETLSPTSTTSPIQQWVAGIQPCNDLRYLPKIWSRISQICLCISVSRSLRWSRTSL